MCSNEFSGCKNKASCSSTRYYKSIFKPRERCGVFGILAHDVRQQVSQLVYHGLMALQHRGQEAAGLSIVNGKRKIFTHKGHGLVFQVLTPEVIRQYWGNVSIGHVRYGTAGSSSIKNAQPHYFTSTNLSFSLAFNGNIANYCDLKEQLISRGRVFTTNSDTEVIANILASLYLEQHDWTYALRKITEYLDGSYSLILLTKNSEIYALRDPLGIKPLCYGKLNDHCDYDIFASESCAIDSIGGKFVDDLKPGEIIKTSINEQLHSEYIVPSQKRALCMFEFVYFARPDSIIDGVSVAQARTRLGKNLAKSCPVDSSNAVVVPVPDSGRSGSIGFAEESGIPYKEGLMKNRYVWRTFIMPGQQRRNTMVRQKLNPIKSAINGKEVVLIDDSIVRGTTTRFIVKLLKEAGATKVHVRITCPEVREPCFMGVDFPTKNELIVGKEELLNNDNYIETVREHIGADSLGYQTIDGLVQAIGLPRNELCLACLNGDYPLKEDPRCLNLSETFSTNRERAL
ncbi:MAG: amidophosphoribosyltransferase [Candidatus Lokiarchaeota archaeon]|nr:amidophosphoribosyltransferase [Candidatus Lokiarchaeota archaeon]